jgi:hypothetical protein
MFKKLNVAIWVSDASSDNYEYGALPGAADGGASSLLRVRPIVLAAMPVARETAAYMPQGTRLFGAPTVLSTKQGYGDPKNAHAENAQIDLPPAVVLDMAHQLKREPFA